MDKHFNFFFIPPLSCPSCTLHQKVFTCDADIFPPRQGCRAPLKEAFTGRAFCYCYIVQFSFTFLLDGSVAWRSSGPVLSASESRLIQLLLIYFHVVCFILSLSFILSHLPFQLSDRLQSLTPPPPFHNSINPNLLVDFCGFIWPCADCTTSVLNHVTHQRPF